MSELPDPAQTRPGDGSDGPGPSTGRTNQVRGSAAARRVEPLDPPMVPFAVGGMAVWAVLVLIMLPLRDRLTDAGHGSWLWICVAGLLFGIPGLVTMLRHDANRRRRAADTAAAESATADSTTADSTAADSTADTGSTPPTR